MGAIQDIMIMGDEPYNDDKGKYDEIVEGLKNNKFGKESIIFITGSGISTKAGIPTFRSKDGLFEKAQKEYNLSRPETILQINIKTVYLKNSNKKSHFKVFNDSYKLYKILFKRRKEKV